MVKGPTKDSYDTLKEYWDELYNDICPQLFEYDPKLAEGIELGFYFGASAFRDLIQGAMYSEFKKNEHLGKVIPKRFKNTNVDINSIFREVDSWFEQYVAVSTMKAVMEDEDLKEQLVDQIMQALKSGKGFAAIKTDIVKEEGKTTVRTRNVTDELDKEFDPEKYYTDKSKNIH